MVFSIQVANSQVSQDNSSDSSLELHGVRAGEPGVACGMKMAWGDGCRRQVEWLRTPTQAGQSVGKRGGPRVEGQSSPEGGGKKQAAHCGLPANYIIRMAE